MPLSFPATRRVQPDWHWSAGNQPSGLGMSPRLDPLTHRFAMWAGRRYATTCADIGCGAGIATAAALVRGARVIAVDPDTTRIQPLLAQLSVRDYARVDLRNGELPARLGSVADLLWSRGHSAGLLTAAEGRGL